MNGRVSEAMPKDGVFVIDGVLSLDAARVPVWTARSGNLFQNRFASLSQLTKVQVQRFSGAGTISFLLRLHFVIEISSGRVLMKYRNAPGGCGYLAVRLSITTSTYRFEI